MARTNVPTRDRILEAASKLFYGGGIRAVSVDAVAAKAGVTKRTFYYHFRSKDDLVASYLDIRDAPNLTMFKRMFNETEGDLADKVAGVFRSLGRLVGQTKWKGCAFLRTSVELVDKPGHPAIVIGRAHKKRVEDWLHGLFEDAGIGKAARQLARQIMLLLDGSFAVVLLHRDSSYMETAAEAAASLIRGAVRG